MELSGNQILYISSITCLFLILNIVVIMKNNIASFSMNSNFNINYFLYSFRNIINNRKKLIYLYNIMNLKHLIILIVVVLIVLVSLLILTKRDQFYFHGDITCEEIGSNENVCRLHSDNCVVKRDSEGEPICQDKCRFSPATADDSNYEDFKMTKVEKKVIMNTFLKMKNKMVFFQSVSINVGK